MTEKDINSIRQTINDLLAIHTAQIDGKFNVITTELSAIKEQTTKTNGTVRKHDAEIRTLQMAENVHVLNCPHNEPMSNYAAIYKFWKPLAITGIVIACISVAGAITTASNFRDLFQKDTAIEQEVQKVKEVSKENKAEIQNSKKAINELGTESAFQNS